MSRILVIDDEPEVLELIAKVLVRAGHEVDLAPDEQARKRTDLKERLSQVMAELAPIRKKS